jgi:hypothetical protein
MLITAELPASKRSHYEEIFDLLDILSMQQSLKTLFHKPRRINVS